jgi:hypothetical protein
MVNALYNYFFLVAAFTLKRQTAAYTLLRKTAAFALKRIQLLL